MFDANLDTSEAFALVHVATDDSSRSSQSLTFWYRTLPTVAGIKPSLGDVGGGTIVTVTGSGWIAGGEVEAMCQFGVTTVPALSIISPTALTCMTPNNTAVGETTFEVSTNGRDFSSSLKSFDFADVPRIWDIAPRFGSPSGSSNVTVLGDGFVVGDYGDPMCRFGNVTRPATVSPSGYELACRSPPLEEVDISIMDYNEPISVPFAVSSNGYDFSDDIQYTYKIPAVILEISPRNALVGEFIELTITGEHLSGDISTLPLCRLESFGNGSAKLLDETTAFCEVYCGDITRTVVEVGLNGHDYVQNSSSRSNARQRWRFQASRQLGAVDGGTKITVTGANFEQD